MNAIQETMRGIRKEFFAFRNGIVADKLRKAGDPHSVIMGCLLVDISGIAARVRETIDDNTQLIVIANELWADTNSRECRLAAPMLYPAEQMSLEQALQWCQTVETVEVADNLCHKLLRHIPEADVLFRKLIADERPLVKYTGHRLLLNLLLLKKLQPTASLKAIVETDSCHDLPALNLLLQDIMEELDGQA
ncbi:MAG: DNA alkylation repair protein [Muribaculaceae bacterium]|nr:DNA alkylation repair protein [Muribaculaceae bacterium]